MASARRGVHPTLGGVFLAAVLSVFPAGIADAGPPAGIATIPAGYDLFETDPGATHFAFQNGTAIPADFFGPGSDPFTGVVSFGGVPLETFGGQDVGDADTVVQRKAAANPAPNDTVPIEIVALNLVSVQPITVTYNGGTSTERWNVSASLSETMPPDGTMQITKSLTGAGGTFNSQLPVIPLLTFTRLSDGLTRPLDAAILPQETLNQLILRGTNVPWQPGCTLPALSVPELNPSFCPGFTPDGKKVRTVEQAALAQHGVYPAQPQLEHFRCWTLQPKPPFDKRQVKLTDQFGSRTADITGRPELCNPARKNLERWQNKAAHLVCYATTGKAVDKLVAVQNQFGSQRLQVLKPVRLCLPTRKRLILSQPTTLPRIRVRIDHFQCYAVEAKTPIRTVTRVTHVTLKDQFVKERVQLGKPYQICAPVRKNQTPSEHRVRHLVCYRTDGQPLSKRVEIRNQFEQKRLVTVAPRGLCVPSNKVVLTQ